MQKRRRTYILRRFLYLVGVIFQQKPACEPFCTYCLYGIPTTTFASEMLFWGNYKSRYRGVVITL